MLRDPIEFDLDEPEVQVDPVEEIQNTLQYVEAAAHAVEGSCPSTAEFLRKACRTIRVNVRRIREAA